MTIKTIKEIAKDMGKPKRKICCNCKHGGKQFKVHRINYLHCEHPKYDGKETAWETLNEIWNGCEDFELKIKELK